MRASPDSLGPSKPSTKRKPRVGLTQFAEAQLRQTLRKTAPSEPWVEAQIKTANDVTPDGQPILYRYFDTKVFPPGGADTLMVRCSRCGVLTPPNALEHGTCLDHASHKGWGPSPSAMAFIRLENANGGIQQLDLAPEDIASLRCEIAEFNRHQNRYNKSK